VNALKEILSAIYPLTQSEWNIVEHKFRREDVAKNEIIVLKGQTENYLYFIEKGILRTWMDKGEKQLTFDFHFENSIYSSYTSFLTRSPSEYNVQAITNMVIWKIHYDELQTIYEQTSTGQIIGRKAAEMLFMEKSKREIALLSKSPEQLYLDLFTEQPELIRQIPLKYIASYIGVTPQALSRIRKRIY
jgi:CRP-like cAMP-binding protein